MLTASQRSDWPPATSNGTAMTFSRLVHAHMYGMYGGGTSASRIAYYGKSICHGDTFVPVSG
jgi:hypothetical protein